jgi:outer membrane protein OmpA-like peptidoglycan-associated protein
VIGGFAVVPAVVLSSASAPGPGPTRIPLCPGLTIVTAIARPNGDYESIKRVATVTDRSVSLRYATQIPTGSSIRDVIASRTVLVDDLKTATLYMHFFSATMALTIPGSTAIGTSAAVLHALKATGKAELGLVPAVYSESEVDRSHHPNVYDYRMAYQLERVGAEPVTIPVLVNGVSTDLPAVRARGRHVGEEAEFFFLDDEANPIALKYRIAAVGGGSGDREAGQLDVVRISYQCASDRQQASTLEKALLESGRVDVYDILFDFNSDRIREESAPRLEEIAGLLGRHPDWKLSIEGHTDGIAGDAYNLELSKRRAAAVKTALTERYRIEAHRLTTTGYGKSRPRDRNDTLEGRAKNRRVELVRQT